MGGRPLGFGVGSWIMVLWYAKKPHEPDGGSDFGEWRGFVNPGLGITNDFS